jgi:hypothetical protein
MTTFLPSIRPALRVLPPPRPSPQFSSSRRAETGGSIRLILAGELDLTGTAPDVAILDHADLFEPRAAVAA